MPIMPSSSPRRNSVKPLPSSTQYRGNDHTDPADEVDNTDEENQETPAENTANEEGQETSPMEELASSLSDAEKTELLAILQQQLQTKEGNEVDMSDMMGGNNEEGESKY